MNVSGKIKDQNLIYLG